jgi:hypothetical protein
MSGFAFGIDLLFTDPFLSLAAIWRSAGVGPAVPVRVIRTAPDKGVDFGEGRFVTDTVFIDVRVSDLSRVEPGDTLEIGDDVFEVRGDPVRDSERLVWRLEARQL